MRRDNTFITIGNLRYGARGAQPTIREAASLPAFFLSTYPANVRVDHPFAAEVLLSLVDAIMQRVDVVLTPGRESTQPHTQRHYTPV
mgnify:CR=1 FL=1